MKRSTKEILKQAGIKDWTKQIKDWAFPDKPAISRESEESLQQCRKHTDLLVTEFERLLGVLGSLGLEGHWDFKGTEEKTTLENAAEFLKQFQNAIHADYVIVDEEPGEDVK